MSKENSMANISIWPYPRIIQGDHQLFIVNRGSPGTAIYIAETYFYREWGEVDVEEWRFFTAGTMLSMGIASDISIADFGPFYVVAAYETVENPTARTMYVSDITEDVPDEKLVDYELITFGTTCNFRGQCIGGNITDAEDESYWVNLSSDCIVWSGIGSFEFDPEVDPTAGFTRLKFAYVSNQRAVIRRVKSLGDKLVVYSDSGINILSPQVIGDTYTFGEEQLPLLGVKRGNYVAGSDSIHGFIDMRNVFWTIDKSGKLSERGYREWISEMVEEEPNIIVSYIARANRFYICNGIRCLLINDFGACHVYQLPSGVVQLDTGELYATQMELSDYEARIVTDSLDFGSRGIKSVESLVSNISTDQADVTMAVEWKSNHNAEFVRGAAKNVNPGGEANIGVAGVDFRLCLTASDFTDTELRYLMANIKYSDQRFKRGTVPAQLYMGR